MVLRKCTICDRRFKKTEHFKRHERSRMFYLCSRAFRSLRFVMNVSPHYGRGA